MEQNPSNTVDELLKKRQETTGTTTGTGTTGAGGNAVTQQSTNNFWGGKPEFEQEPTINEEPAATQPAATQVKPPAPAGIPDKALRESAEMAVSAVIEMPLEILGTAAIWLQLNRKSKKAFPNPEDRERAMDLADSDAPPADEQEARMKRKMLSLMRKGREKEKSLPLGETERKTMVEGFYQKFKVEQKTLDPNMMLYASIFTAIGTRAFDIATDW